ncbi:hypothetical protein RF11_16324 [Thelohanellus kitauei]|uniref:Uncharacterized protein n=1 Tax=Thelohanellus kitauei TaxID=669202 RepID=A0A0C2J0W9_THEKT|nr:hypothetical protein RF11_16324 [Thelohanellus kitauei]
MSNELRLLIIAALNHGNNGICDLFLRAIIYESIDPLQHKGATTLKYTSREGICHELLSISPDRQEGRELTEIRATRVVLTLRSRNFSVGCTISCEAMVNFKISERAYNSELFLEYLLEIFETFEHNRF